MVFYDKEARLRQMRQRKGLPEPQVATVNHNVRLDVTFHSLGVKELVRQARPHLKRLLQIDPSISTRLAGEDYLVGPPESTIRALKLGIRILSHVERNGKVVRVSFGEWLIPYVLRHILHLDVITGFTVEKYQEFLGLHDPVAVAWRSAKPADINDPNDLKGKQWARTLAEKAGVSLQTVYDRRNLWLKRYGIDIKLPNAYYYGVLYYGPNSVTTGRDQQATLAAHSARDGQRLLRLRDKATQEFDRLRIEVVGRTINAPLHQMPVAAAASRPGTWVANFMAPVPSLGPATPVVVAPQLTRIPVTREQVAPRAPVTGVVSSAKGGPAAKSINLRPAASAVKLRPTLEPAGVKSAPVAHQTPVTLAMIKSSKGPVDAVRNRTPPMAHRFVLTKRPE